MSKKILVLTANPDDTAKLGLDEEVRKIDDGLRRAKNRDAFEFETKWAVRIDDLRRALLDHEPQIVHFSGHGLVEGIMVKDDAGKAVLVNPKGLAGLFKLCNEHVECVLLNACLSETQAKAINEHIPYVIGMNTSIGDQAAIAFAVGFYDALGAGKSYKKAFDFGVNAVELMNIPEESTPVLLENKNIVLPQQESAKTESPAADLPPRTKARNPQLYDILAEKIRRIENAWALETDPARRYQVEKQLEDAKNDLRKMCA